VLERGFAQFLPVVQVVRGISEAGLPVDAALDDVLRHAGEIDAWLSDHECIRKWMQERVGSAEAIRSTSDAAIGNEPDPI
jgi:hypothetical protein